LAQEIIAYPSLQLGARKLPEYLPGILRYGFLDGFVDTEPIGNQHEHGIGGGIPGVGHQRLDIGLGLDLVGSEVLYEFPDEKSEPFINMSSSDATDVSWA